MIELRAVQKRYVDHVVLDQVSLRVEAGSTLALVGPSGCGKTTTLKLINRLVQPTAGVVLVDGDDVSEVDEVSLRRRIGYVVQEAGLFPHMTARQNVEIVPRLLGWSRQQLEQRLQMLFDLVGLSLARFAQRYPAELSGGQRQRIGLARALAADPDVVLMDEPFGALDPITRRRLQQEFLQIRRQLDKTVVFVTHDMNEAFLLADQIAVLAEGTLQQAGPPQAFRDNPASPIVRELLSAHLAPT